jgi:NAD+ diphosphatase
LSPERVLPVGLLGEQLLPCGLVRARHARARRLRMARPAQPAGHARRWLAWVWPDARGQIAEWARTHRYCGACAHADGIARCGERCFKCPACGMMAYPRISPAMMVLIRKGDQVLLAMHTASPSKRFTPLAGFLEAGESIEEAVHREVYEEVGLRVQNLQYFSSQSWPFPHSLMIGFTADYLAGEIRIDENELSEARWFGPNDEWPERVPHICPFRA